MILLKICTCATALLLLNFAVPTVFSEENNGSIMYEAVDWELLKMISNEKAGNVVFSPFSLKVLLALLYEGANDDTATSRDLRDVCHFPKNLTTLRTKYSDLINDFKKLSKLYELDVNSKLFLNSAYKLSPHYNKRIKDFYDTESQNTNFNESVSAADSINEWAARATHGKIKEIVKAEDVSDAVMILLNAVFFKGKWNMKFDSNYTKKGGFYIDRENTVNVEYMENLDRYEYFEHPTLDAKFLRIPFKDEKFVMTIVLPNSKPGLNKLISSITVQDLTFVNFYFEKPEVHVILPKFEFKSDIKFNNILKTMGLRKIFDNSASFGRILEAGSTKPGQGIFVSGILQKAGIEVNEEGSTAYVATEIELGNKFNAPENIFNASNPFLFFIEHQESSSILFAGKVVDPSEGKTSTDHQQTINSGIKVQDSSPSETANRFSGIQQGKGGYRWRYSQNTGQVMKSYITPSGREIKMN